MSKLWKDEENKLIKAVANGLNPPMKCHIDAQSYSVNAAVKA